MSETLNLRSMSEWFVLDPSVEVIEPEPRPHTMWSADPRLVRRGWLLLNHAQQIAALLPPGPGLRELILELRKPFAIAELLDDEDPDLLLRELLANLAVRGFLLPLEQLSPPEPATLERVRAGWRHDVAAGRRTIHLDLRESSGALATATGMAAAAGGQTVVVHGLGDGDQSASDQQPLAASTDEAYEVVVEAAGPAWPPAKRVASLATRFRFRVAFEHLDSVELGQLEALAAERVAVTAVVAVGVTILDPSTADALCDWVTRWTISRLVLEIDLESWPSTSATEHRDQAVAIHDIVDSLVERVGDVGMAGFPTDDEILGEAQLEEPGAHAGLEGELRRLHLGRRARALLDLEGNCVWGQNPPAEELWVPAADDLLPNQPALLGLKEGSVVADIAGGLGRVARRLSPHVGETGTIISIEKESVLSYQARRFVIDGGQSNIQCRVGLGQRLPLASGSVDAAVIEWAGAIFRGGLLGHCVGEMTRVIRSGGRLAISYRLCNIRLDKLDEIAAPYPKLYASVLTTLSDASLTLVAEPLWLIRPQMSGAPAAWFEERYLPRLIDDLRGRRVPEQEPNVDLYLTAIAEKVP